ncbi:MAG: iron chelate uptake ABC transporter family permease subunit, partial [Comamonas sp.]
MTQDLYVPAQRPSWWSHQRNRLASLVVMAVIAVLAFMTMGVEADWAFVLEHRGLKVITMIVVACALGMSTVVFQTVTHNTILTPAVMGLDALYLFLQSVLVLVLGSVGVVGLGVYPKFGLEIVLMVVLSVALMRWLFTGHA